MPNIGYYYAVKSLPVYFISLLAVCAAVHGALQLPWRATDAAVMNPDAWEYFDATRRLYAWPPLPHPTRTFGWPLASGWITRWSADPLVFFNSCYWLNLAFFTATGVLLWRLGALLCPERPVIARLPAWLFALNAGSIVLVSQPLTETLYTFLLVSAAGGWVLARTRSDHRWLVAAWCLFCFSAVVRPAGAVWLLPLGAALGIHGFKNINIGRWKWFAAVAPVILTVGIQVCAMRLTYRTTRLSEIGLWTWYFYTDAYAAGWDGRPGHDRLDSAWMAETTRRRIALDVGPPQHAAVLRIGDWPALEKYMAASAAETIRERPAAVAATLLRNFASNSVGGSMTAESLYRGAAEPGVRRRAGAIFYLSRLQNAVYSFAALLLLGRLVFRRRAANPVAGALTGFAVFVMLCSAISFAQGDRFHVAVAPLVWLAFVTLFSSARTSSTSGTNGR